MGLTASKATLEVPGGQKLQLDSKGVFVGSSSTKIEIAPSGTVTWTAPLVNFL